jgi:Skp family chaperone for outer membrane proteins
MMENMKILTFVLENLDLIVGVIVLFMACMILPASVRWYVLSFGVLLMGTQIWQRMRAKGRFEKLDKQRAELKKKLEELEGVSEEMKAKNAALEKKAAELEKERQEQLKRRGELQQKDEELSATQQSLQQKTDDNIKEIDSVRDNIRQILDARGKFMAAQALGE